MSLFTWGQGLEGLIRFNPDRVETDGQEKIIEVEFTYGYDLDNYPYYQMIDDANNHSQTNFRKYGVEVADIRYISNKTGKWVIFLPENSTGQTRSIEFMVRNTRLRILQASLPSITVFDVVGGGTIYPGQTHTISLSGSEIGVLYKIRNSSGKVVGSLLGTGAELRFTGTYDEGIYIMTALKDNYEKTMNGRIIVDYPSILSSISAVTPSEYTFPQNGGEIDVTIEGSVEITHDMLKSFQGYVQYCNQGLNYDWHENYQISRVRQIAANKIMFRVTADRNFDIFPPDGGLYLSHGLYFLIDQDRGDGILIYETLGGGDLNASTLSVPIKLSGTQDGYTYRLLKNGESIKTFTGNGQEYITNVSEPGRYSIEWYYKNQSIGMRGNVLVERSDGNTYSSDKSYMVTRNYIDPTTTTNDAKYNTTVSYVDGLGRSVQNILVKASPTGRNVYSFSIYDRTGRKTKNYLPFTKSGSPTFNPNIVAEQTIFYQDLYGSSNPAYSEVKYDDSPYDKIIEQSSPGASWKMGNGHTTRLLYRKNTETDRVKRFLLNGSSLTFNGYYLANTLMVFETVDPQGGISLEFEDPQGHIIAKRTQSDNDQITTYQVYDLFGRLRYVIPPVQEELFTANSKSLTELQKYCYYSEYDEYGRLYKQYVPGSDYTINLYDKRGRLVFSQDAKQRVNSKWRFSKYDEFDRVIITGICTGTESEHKTALANQAIYGEQRGTSIHGYTNLVYPTSITENDCLNITYYDDYTWVNQNLVSFLQAEALGQKMSNNVIGKQTGGKTKVLGISSNQWLISALYYNDNKFTIQKVEQLYPSGTQVSTNAWDFVGNVSRAKVKQTIGSLVTEYNKYFTYDSQGRLLKIEQQITGDEINGKVTLVENTYGELGQVAMKKNHNGKHVNSYSYNISGKTTGVTSPSFSYYLDYDNLNVTGATPRYDGGINAFRWKNGNSTEKAFVYTYDMLSQMTSASYRENNGNWSNTNNRYNVSGITYDHNGNLKTLIRNNHKGEVLHNLKYTYAHLSNGNAVSDLSENGSTKNYIYDQIGNVISDGRREVAISYNEINLPKEITKGLEKISYIYSAKGEKLALKVGSSLIYYRDMMVYNGNNLSNILHSEGLIRKSNNGYIYTYALRDYLGSTRVLLEAGTSGLTTIQTTEYYPFGLAFETNELDKNKYLFIGKEYQDAQIGGKLLALYDFGARFYDPVVGRWFCEDPALQLINPYIFSGNNPVFFIDENGEFVWLIPALIGATLNIIENWDAISSAGGWKAVGLFLGYGALGAFEGYTSTLGPIGRGVGSFARGAGNSLLRGKGFGNSFLDGGVAVIGSSLGGEVGSKLGKLTHRSLGKVLENQQMLLNVAVGVVESVSEGFTGDVAEGVFRGEQSIGDALKNAAKPQRLIANSLLGTVQGVRKTKLERIKPVLAIPSIETSLPSPSLERSLILPEGMMPTQLSIRLEPKFLMPGTRVLSLPPMRFDYFLPPVELKGFDYINDGIKLNGLLAK